MKLNSINGGVIALLIFTGIAFGFGGMGPKEDVDLIITISTFLFSILAGFSITRLHARHHAIKSLSSREDALLLSLYKTAGLGGKKFQDKFREMIDEYYTTAEDFGYSQSHYKFTAAHFLNMFDYLKKLRFKHAQPLSWMLEILTNLEEVRNMLSIRIKQKLGKSRWMVLIILATIIIFSLFYIERTSISSNIVTILLTTSLIVVLLIIRDHGSLEEFSERHALDESSQEVLEAIGKKRYYHKKYKHLIPKFVKEYRLGVHEVGDPKKIKVVKKD